MTAEQIARRDRAISHQVRPFLLCVSFWCVEYNDTETVILLFEDGKNSATAQSRTGAQSDILYFEHAFIPRASVL